MTGLAAVAALLASSIHIGVRAVPSTNGLAELELRNVSGVAIEGPAETGLSLVPLDRTKPPLYQGSLWTTVDPNAGVFSGRLAEGPRSMLRLGPNEVRTVRVQLTALMWSLSPRWVWQPRTFWELTAEGEFELSAVLLLFTGGSALDSSSKPARIRISGE